MDQESFHDPPVCHSWHAFHDVCGFFLSPYLLVFRGLSEDFHKSSNAPFETVKVWTDQIYVC